jgi:translation initiation factor 2 subunit 3
MVKKEDIANLETINVIIAGHIDHGKTTLLQKLSGKWTDTHSEELKRGITIKLGYADTVVYEGGGGGGYNITGEGKAKRYVSFVDAPGHEMLMATMLSGAAIVDAAILVVAANEGIRPQTKEHLMALQAKDINNIIIVQNKIDLVSRGQAEKSYGEIKDFFKGTIAEGAPIIPISAQQGINISEVLKEICGIKIPERNISGTPIFFVARSFDINKPGTKPNNLNGSVLGGTLKSGTLKQGDHIEIKPGIVVKEGNQIKYHTVKTKIKSLHKGSYEMPVITPGGSMSIETELDMSIGKTDTLSGCVVSTPGKLPEITSELKLEYELFPEILGTHVKSEVEQLKTTETLMLSANTSVSVGTITKIDNGIAELSLKIPIVPFGGESVGIARNINNHWRLIGYGKII